MQLPQRIIHYTKLMRLDKPIGIFLLLWPTLSALWLASVGRPDGKLLFIFISGVILMRSAGCVINDYFDRQVDGLVERTQKRPLPSGAVSPVEAVILAAGLLTLAFMLVLFCNGFTIMLAMIGACFAILYPLLKRVTHLPQLGLGLAFAWGVPMAFAAATGTISLSAWFLFLTGLVLPLIYDTMYAMVDRPDDLKAGIKSAAILFNSMDKMIIGLLQILFIAMMVIVGFMFKLHFIYYLSLMAASVLFVFQQWLIKSGNRAYYLKAFLNNQWVGFAIFLGVCLSYPA